MNQWFGGLRGLGRVLILCVVLAAGGCEGTDTRDQVDDTVEEMTGKKNLDRFKQMKDDLGEIQTQQTENYRQLEENDDDK